MLLQHKGSWSGRASTPNVNHNLMEAFEKGVVAHFKVEGEWNNELMTAIMAAA